MGDWIAQPQILVRFPCESLQLSHLSALRHTYPPPRYPHPPTTSPCLQPIIHPTSQPTTNLNFPPLLSTPPFLHPQYPHVLHFPHDPPTSHHTITSQTPVTHSTNTRPTHTYRKPHSSHKHSDHPSTSSINPSIQHTIATPSTSDVRSFPPNPTLLTAPSSTLALTPYFTHPRKRKFKHE